MGFGGSGLFLNFFVPNGQVLLEMAHTRFKMVSTNLSWGQNGHFWTKNVVLELFWALEPPRSGHRGPIL